MENATVRGTLTITGGTLGVPLELNNITVGGDFDLTAFEGNTTFNDVVVDGDIFQ
ncbi:hypothetical protein [Planococcus beigongshangi]|uniref:hypothetical protein n=1 Tax=Planococcus beigongshangi TaxID=2782536 RepID=UPI00193C0F87|nr:hypothetical protein [Planococcus beigongshangi]